MRALTYLVSVSLDGYIADAAGDTRALPAPPDLIAAVAEEYPETFTALERAALGLDGPARRFDTVLMGAGTYNKFVERGQPSPFPHLTQIVLATAARELARQHPDVQFTDAPAPDVLRALRAQESSAGVWLCGGAQLARSLVSDIDRLVLKICPIVLGDGVRLFAAGTPTHDLEFRQVRPLPSGAVVASYHRLRPAG